MSPLWQKHTHARSPGLLVWRVSLEAISRDNTILTPWNSSISLNQISEARKEKKEEKKKQRTKKRRLFNAWNADRFTHSSSNLIHLWPVPPPCVLCWLGQVDEEPSEGAVLSFCSRFRSGSARGVVPADEMSQTQYYMTTTRPPPCTVFGENDCEIGWFCMKPANEPALLFLTHVPRTTVVQDVQLATVNRLQNGFCNSNAGEKPFIPVQSFIIWRWMILEGMETLRWARNGDAGTVLSCRDGGCYVADSYSHVLLVVVRKIDRFADERDSLAFMWDDLIGNERDDDDDCRGCWSSEHERKWHKEMERMQASAFVGKHVIYICYWHVSMICCLEEIKSLKHASGGKEMRTSPASIGIGYSYVISFSKV